MIDAFMIICQKIWETKTWPKEWTKSLKITIPKKGISNLRFVDDIDLIAGTEEELQELTTTLERRVCAYGMEVQKRARSWSTAEWRQ